MPKFTLNNEFIPVSVYFVENCIKNVGGGFLKVYLYALGLATKGAEVDTETVAKELDMLESDVLQAFSYWKSVGMIIEDGGVIEFLSKPQTEELFPVIEQPSHQEFNNQKKPSYDSEHQRPYSASGAPQPRYHGTDLLCPENGGRRASVRLRALSRNP